MIGAPRMPQRRSKKAKVLELSQAGVAIAEIAAQSGCSVALVHVYRAELRAAGHVFVGARRRAG